MMSDTPQSALARDILLTSGSIAGSLREADPSASRGDAPKAEPVARILIVDDHAFIRRGIQSILKASPEWDVCGEGENGAVAIRLARELKPDLIIMDVSMPEMNGIEAARVIHQLEPQIKIVLLTLHESSELVRSAFRAGVQGYLLKSEAEQELLRALTVVSGQGTYISPKVDPHVAQSVTRDISGSSN